MTHSELAQRFPWAGGLALGCALIAMANGRPLLGWALIATVAIGWLTGRRLADADLRGAGVDDGAALGVIATTCAALVALGAVLMGG